MKEFITPLIEVAALALEVIGAIVIVAAAVIEVTMVVAALTRRRRIDWQHTRRTLLRGLVLGLEFLIGADILRTIAAPTIEELAVLGAIIVLRTVLALSIDFELRHAGRET